MRGTDVTTFPCDVDPDEHETRRQIMAVRHEMLRLAQDPATPRRAVLQMVATLRAQARAHPGMASTLYRTARKIQETR